MSSAQSLVSKTGVFGWYSRQAAVFSFCLTKVTQVGSMRFLKQEHQWTRPDPRHQRHPEQTLSLPPVKQVEVKGATCFFAKTGQFEVQRIVHLHAFICFHCPHSPKKAASTAPTWSHWFKKNADSSVPVPSWPGRSSSSFRNRW